MTIGIALFVVIALASCVLMVTGWQARQHATKTDRTLDRLDNFLTAWAEYGDWNPQLAERLKQIVGERNEDI